MKLRGFTLSYFSQDALIVGNNKNFKLITVTFLSLELENLKTFFRLRGGWNFSVAKSRVLMPRHPICKFTILTSCKLRLNKINKMINSD